MKIMLVDDDDTQIYWLERIFVPEGHDVVSCSNGVEALRAYKKKGPFDVVLSDFQMPEMDGVELALAIRQICPDQHIVLQTSKLEHLIPGIPQLLKPYSRRQLERALRAPVQPLLF